MAGNEIANISIADIVAMRRQCSLDLNNDTKLDDIAFELNNKKNDISEFISASKRYTHCKDQILPIIIALVHRKQ